MQCLILAGGFATRLWPLTERRSKPLLPLAGKPLLTHLLERVPAKIPVTVSTNAVFAGDMQAWAKTVQPRAVDIYVEDAGHEREKLGALGAVSRWIRERGIQDDVLLLAGDNYIGFDCSRLFEAYKERPLLAAHDIRDAQEAKRFGTVLLQTRGGDTGTVEAFEEKPAAPKSTLVSTGCYVLPKDTLPVLVTYAQSHPDNIGGIFEEFLAQKIPVDCMIFTEMWRDIGSFHAYLQTHADVLRGTHMIDPTATVDDATMFEDSVVVGAHCRVSKSMLKNCMLFGDSVIDDCVLEDCVIDTGCTLRGIDLRGKMLRRGTTLNRR